LDNKIWDQAFGPALGGTAGKTLEGEECEVRRPHRIGVALDPEAGLGCISVTKLVLADKRLKYEADFGGRVAMPWIGRRQGGYLPAYELMLHSVVREAGELLGRHQLALRRHRPDSSSID